MVVFTSEVHQNPFLPEGETEVHAVVSVTARTDGEPPGPVAVAEVILLDCSGSMAGRKAAEAVEAVCAAIDVLRDGVAFAVVRGTHVATMAYPDTVRLAEASEATRAAAKAAVRRMRPGGGTAIGRWLLLARALMATRPDAVHHATLLTGGQNGEDEPEFAAALGACEGVFQCDCLGIGADWRVAELRRVATTLIGTVKLLRTGQAMVDDLRAVVEKATTGSVEVDLRVWTPKGATTRFLRQVFPETADLTDRGVDVTALTRAYPTGAWEAGTREYHLCVAVVPGPVWAEKLAARVSVVVGDTVLSEAILRAEWTDDSDKSVRINDRVARYTGQAELAQAIQDGLEARRDGDEAAAVTHLGQAAKLAAEADDEGTIKRLATVVDVVDAAAAKVRLKRTLDVLGEMDLDVSSTRHLAWLTGQRLPTGPAGTAWPSPGHGSGELRPGSGERGPGSSELRPGQSPSTDSRRQASGGRVPLWVRAQTDAVVREDEVSTVVVLLSRRRLGHRTSSTDGSGSGEADPAVPVLVEVVPRRNVEVVGDPVRQTTVPDSDQPVAMTFDFRPTRPGTAQVWIVVRQGSTPLMEPLVLTPSVLDAQAGSDAHVPAVEAAGSGYATSQPPAPLRVLRINEEFQGGSVVYRYDLEAPDLRLLASYTSAPIVGSREEYIRSLYRRIESCWVASSRDVEMFSEQVRAFGGDLFDQLVPVELQAVLWENRHRLRDVLLLSTEPYIPWELLHLKDPASRQLPRDTWFLGELGLVRWMWGPGLWQELTVGRERVRYVIPDYPHSAMSLPELDGERKFLERRLGAKPVVPHHREVVAALRDVSVDLLHIAGHGTASGEDIADAQVLLEGRSSGADYLDEPLRVSVVRQNFDRTDVPGSGPMIVVNACQVGRLGHQLATVGGFAEAFIKGGAALFVGCLWSVGDAPARTFVETFYDQLTAGATVAEATTSGRRAARAAGDATWLAYTVYAHPQARLVWRPTATSGQD